MTDTPARRTLHILGNAHLDPVWLWDWREGLNEGMVTCRTILDLMDEDPDLTFVRGEAVIYDHIERHDPATFERIRARVADGRWDVVGGTWLQADTNMPATETFARHYARGQNYFRERFGAPVRVAWTADSFGHSAGLPEIYAAAGLEGLFFTRPDTKKMGVDSPAFWWEGQGGSRVLAYRPSVGWYGCDRHDFAPRLDATLADSQGQPLRNIGVYCGLGNHGGGPTRRHIAEIREWAAAHPEVDVVWSGLHRLIDAVKAEIAAPDAPAIPVHRGELNFVLRGCYVSMAGLKIPYRRAEAAVAAVERTDVAIAAARGVAPAALGELWDGVLFNSFHDILPGSSIERACDDQKEWLGGLLHQARRAEVTALNALAQEVDTTRRTPDVEDHPTTVSLLVWNPHPWPVDGVVELEAAIDYRPRSDYRDRHDDMPLLLLDAAGQPVAHQRIAHEHLAFPFLPWRFRVAASLRLPACGWQAVEFGWVPDAPTVDFTGDSVSAPTDTSIAGGGRRVAATIGGTGLDVEIDGRKLFGDSGMRAVLMEDAYGAWGDMDESTEGCDISTVRETWTVMDVRVVEPGPICARLWLRLEGRRSSLELTATITAGSDHVDIAARLLWNDRDARLKLVMPGADTADFQVPGGTQRREPCGEVPGGRWVRVGSDGAGFGFASDALYGFDCKDGEFRASVIRSPRFSQSHPAPTDPVWLPASDQGEHRFTLRLTPYAADLDRAAAELERPPTVMLTTATPGPRPRSASLAAIRPASIKVLGLKSAESGDDLILQVQNVGAALATVQFTWQGEILPLGDLAPWRIAAWRLTRHGTTWRATPTDLREGRAEKQCDSGQSDALIIPSFDR